MSRNVWMVIGGLGMATAVAFGCLGTLLVLYLTGALAIDTSARVQPAATLTRPTTQSPTSTSAPPANPTGAPTPRRPTATPAVPGADHDYLTCAQPVGALWVDFFGSLPSGNHCAIPALESWPDRAARVRDIHLNCPVPDSPHLQAAKMYTDNALAEFAESMNCLTQYCQSRDEYWHAQYLEHGSLANDWLGQASTELDRFNEEPAPAPSPQMSGQYDLALLASRGYRSQGGDYFIVEGQVKNISDSSLENIVAVATAYDSSEQFITYDDALIDYTTLLPGQTSPFSVMIDYNPAIEYYDIEFTKILGSPISTRDER